MTVFDNVRDQMLAFDSLLLKNKQARALMEEIAKNPLTDLNPLRTKMGDFFRGPTLQDLVNVGQLGQAAAGGAAGGLSDTSDDNNLSNDDIRKIQAIAKFSLALESVTIECLQDLAYLDPNNLVVVRSFFNRHQAEFGHASYTLPLLDDDLIRRFYYKAVQTLIQKKLWAIDAADNQDLVALSTTADVANYRNAVFGGRVYGDLRACGAARNNVLTDEEAALLHCQAVAIKGLLEAKFTLSERQKLMDCASHDSTACIGLACLSDAHRMIPFVVQDKNLPSPEVLKEVYNSDRNIANARAYAAIAMLNRGFDLKDKPTNDPIHAAVVAILGVVDSQQKAEVVAALMKAGCLVESITQDRLNQLSAINQKEPVLKALLRGVTNPDQQAALLQDFIALPHDQKNPVVAQALNRFPGMDADSQEKRGIIIQVVGGILARGFILRPDDISEKAINELHALPAGAGKGERDNVIFYYARLEPGIRHVSVAKACDRYPVELGFWAIAHDLISYLAKNNILNESALSEEIIDSLYNEITRLTPNYNKLNHVQQDAAINNAIKNIVDYFAQVLPEANRTLQVIQALIKHNPQSLGATHAEATARCQIIVGLASAGAPISAEISDGFNDIYDCAPGEAVNVGKGMRLLLGYDPANQRLIIADWNKVVDPGNKTGAVAEALARYKNDNAAAPAGTSAAPYKPNDFDKRAVVVKLANLGLNTKEALSEDVIEVIAQASAATADQDAMIALLVALKDPDGKPDGQAIQEAVIVLKESKAPNSGQLQQIIEAQKIKFTVVKSENDPENLRKSISNMQSDYKMNLICDVPGQKKRVLLPVNSVPSDAKPCGLQATLRDESHTLINEFFAERVVRVEPQLDIKDKGLFTLLTVKELAMYAKKRDMSIELDKMDPKNEVKVKVTLAGEIKEIPFKVLFFLAAAAQGLRMQEKGNVLFEPLNPAASNREKRQKDQIENYLTSAGTRSSMGLSSEQQKELIEDLFKASPSSAPTAPTI